MPHEWHRGDYTISTDPNRLDFDLIYDFLSNRSYWAQGRTLDTIRTSIQNSLPFGLYLHGDNKDNPEQQIGFCRVVTDSATFAWLADVFILPDHRGRKLGEWLIETVLSHPDLQTLGRWVLATRDAHTLYAKFGFQPLENPDRFMMRRLR